MTDTEMKIEASDLSDDLSDEAIDWQEAYACLGCALPVPNL